MPRRAPVEFCALALALALLAACGKPRSTAVERLPELEIVPGSVTVSGISAGGYMAVQFHVAYSGLVNGVGVIAAGPYYCAESSLRHALGRCMRSGDEIPVAQLATFTSELALEDRIDPISDLANDQVWILHGARDNVVDKRVVDALESYYGTLVEPRGIVRIEQPGAAHTFPTSRRGRFLRGVGVAVCRAMRLRRRGCLAAASVSAARAAGHARRGRPAVVRPAPVRRARGHERACGERLGVRAASLP